MSDEMGSALPDVQALVNSICYDLSIPDERPMVEVDERLLTALLQRLLVERAAAEQRAQAAERERDEARARAERAEVAVVALRGAVEALAPEKRPPMAAPGGHCLYCGADDHEDHAYTNEELGPDGVWRRVEHRREDCPWVRAQAALADTAAVAAPLLALVEAARDMVRFNEGAYEGDGRGVAERLRAAVAALAPAREPQPEQPPRGGEGGAR